MSLLLALCLWFLFYRYCSTLSLLLTLFLSLFLFLLCSLFYFLFLFALSQRLIYQISEFCMQAIICEGLHIRINEHNQIFNRINYIICCIHASPSVGSNGTQQFCNSFCPNLLRASLITKSPIWLVVNNSTVFRPKFAFR